MQRASSSIGGFILLPEVQRDLPEKWKSFTSGFDQINEMTSDLLFASPDIREAPSLESSSANWSLFGHEGFVGTSLTPFKDISRGSWTVKERIEWEGRRSACSRMEVFASWDKMLSFKVEHFPNRESLEILDTLATIQTKFQTLI